jgi:ArsR family transcriptional regulator
MEMLKYDKAPGSELCDSTERAQHIAEILKAIGHPLRLRIVALLCQGRQHVSALSERLNEAQPIISQHLRILRMRELVCVEREAGYAYYRLKELNLSQLVHCMEGCA